MKKQYALALLMLIAFGVVSTMAFTLNTVDTTGTMYSVSEGSGILSVDSVKIWAQGQNKMRIKFTVSTSSADTYDGELYITLLDGSGNAITVPTGPAGDGWDTLNVAIDGADQTETGTTGSEILVKLIDFDTDSKTSYTVLLEIEDSSSETISDVNSIFVNLDHVADGTYSEVGAAWTTLA